MGAVSFSTNKLTSEAGGPQLFILNCVGARP